MNEDRYLVDNNALLALGRDRRNSEFFRSFCRLPEEVLYEARSSADINSLRALAYDTTPDVLRQLQAVMSGLVPGNTGLVDLYQNKGAADPLVIAAALDAISRENDLFPDTWTIVTNDKAVRAAAEELSVLVITPSAFASIIDTARGKS